MGPWIFDQLHPLRPGFWIALSLVMALLGLLVEQRLRPDWKRTLRMLRWILVPYLGLVAGGLSPRFIGLSDLDWVAGLGLGLALIVGLWLLLLLVRITLQVEEPPQPPREIDARRRPSLSQWARHVAHAGTQEFHWCFLRGAVRETLLALPVALPAPLATPAYAAIWLASLLALPEILVYYDSATQRIIAVVVLTMTAILFFYTRNFWLCWLLHASAQFILGQRMRPQAPASSSAERRAEMG